MISKSVYVRAFVLAGVCGYVAKPPPLLKHVCVEMVEVISVAVTGFLMLRKN